MCSRPDRGAAADRVARSQVMMRAAHIAAAAVIACGGGGGAPLPATPLVPPSGTERLLAMLPQGAEIVLEVDLARLRGNAVIGAVVTRALAGPDAEVGAASRGGLAAAWLRGALRRDADPAGDAESESPIAIADQLVLAAYGVGTAQAATLVVLGSRREIADATRLADDAYALGPPEWVEQAVQRVGRAGGAAIRPAPELLELRAHAMPADAPGASLRMTAQLPFDARVALARQTGLEVAPAQVSVWGDVADDAALIVDCDATDPGSAAGAGRGDASRRLAATLRTVLAGVADLPAIRQLGLPSSLVGARLVARGRWVRMIIAIGPEHLHRVVERAAGLLGGPAAPALAPHTSALTGDPPS
jgi:hypothetical protein